MALDLIKDYEVFVTRGKARIARVGLLMNDLASLSTEELVTKLQEGGTEAEAALRIVVARRFPTIPEHMLDQLAVPLSDAQETPTWNRRTRRRLAKTGGILVHAFGGASRRAFETTASEAGIGHLPVDQKEDLIQMPTYRYLLQQAVEGRVRPWVGGPPCRTYSVCRYMPLGDTWLGPRRIRNRGHSLSEIDQDRLTGSETAMRRVDDLLFLRFMILFDISALCCHALMLPKPAFILEQPEDPERWSESKDRDRSALPNSGALQSGHA